MSTLNLKAQLNNLVGLQKIDSEIYALRREKEAKPEEIKAMELSYETKKQHLAGLEKESLELQKKKKDQELELSSKEENTKKLQTQLYSLKTNKEYQVMLGQIGSSKADASVVEDKILELLEQTDKIKGDIDKEKLRLKEEEENFNEQKQKVEARVKEIDERLAQLEDMRKQLTPEINPKILSGYERILLNRDSLAIVTAKNNSCGGCNMFLPPQVINLIKMYEHVVTCESCNRMLYIEDETNEKN